MPKIGKQRKNVFQRFAPRRPEVSPRDPSQFEEDHDASKLLEENLPEDFKKRMGETGLKLSKKAADAMEETGKQLWYGADAEQRYVDRQKEQKRKSAHYLAEMTQAAQAEELYHDVLDVTTQQAQSERQEQQLRMKRQMAEQYIAHKKKEVALEKDLGELDRNSRKQEVEADLKTYQEEHTLERWQSEETERLDMAAALNAAYFDFEKQRHEKDLKLTTDISTELMKEYETDRKKQLEDIMKLKMTQSQETVAKEHEEVRLHKLRTTLQTYETRKDNQELEGRLLRELVEIEGMEAAATAEAERVRRKREYERNMAELAAQEEEEANKKSQLHNKQEKEALQMDLSKITSGLNICATSVLHQATIVERRRELQNQVEDAIGVNKENNDRIASIKKKLQLAKVLFLLVILGCELDLFGFALAYYTYQKAGEEVVFNGTANNTVQTHPDEHYVISWLLVIGPTGYMLATTMYILWTSGCATWSLRKLGECLRENCEMDVDFVKSVGTTDLRQKLIETDSALRVQVRLEEGKIIKAGDDGPILTALEYNQFQLDLCREPITLKFYHFLPVFRYYLLVKDTESSDVESLFRVNGLSTFTLGFAQVSCMIIGITTGILQIDFFIKFGIFAQVVNMIMTGVYFFTDYPEVMKSSMSVEAFQYNARRSMQGEFTRYKQVVDQYSLDFGSRIPSMDLAEFLHDLPEAPANGSPAPLLDVEAPVQEKEMSEYQQELLKELKHFRFRVLRDINEIAHLQLNLAPFSTQQLFEWRAKMVAHQVVKYGEIAGI